MKLKHLFWITLAMLALDWTLGVLHVAVKMPVWSFLVFNFPFGIPSVWLESSWNGTSYVLNGEFVDEAWSFVAFFFAVIGQALLYAWVWGHVLRQREAR